MGLVAQKALLNLPFHKLESAKHLILDEGVDLYVVSEEDGISFHAFGPLAESITARDGPIRRGQSELVCMLEKGAPLLYLSLMPSRSEDATTQETRARNFMICFNSTKYSHK